MVSSSIDGRENISSFKTRITPTPLLITRLVRYTILLAIKMNVKMAMPKRNGGAYSLIV
jgi:hypothetical protein